MIRLIGLIALGKIQVEAFFIVTGHCSSPIACPLALLSLLRALKPSVAVKKNEKLPRVRVRACFARSHRVKVPLSSCATMTSTRR
jgi:hypothetical protein